MTYFKLNIPKINEEISNYKAIKKEYYDDIILAHNSLSNIQNAWNDANSKIFAKKIKKNANSTMNFFEYLDELYNELSTFNENIDKICHKFGFSYDSVILKFDDREIQKCFTYLNNAIYYLDNILTDFIITDFDVKYHVIISDFLTEVKKIKTNTTNVLNSVNNFINLVNDELHQAKIRVNKIEKNNINVSEMN